MSKDRKDDRYTAFIENPAFRDIKISLQTLLVNLFKTTFTDDDHNVFEDSVEYDSYTPISFVRRYLSDPEGAQEGCYVSSFIGDLEGIVKTLKDIKRLELIKKAIFKLKTLGIDIDHPLYVYASPAHPKKIDKSFVFNSNAVISFLKSFNSSELEKALYLAVVTGVRSEIVKELAKACREVSSDNIGKTLSDFLDFVDQSADTQDFYKMAFVPYLNHFITNGSVDSIEVDLPLPPVYIEYLDYIRSEELERYCTKMVTTEYGEGTIFSEIYTDEEDSMIAEIAKNGGGEEDEVKRFKDKIYTLLQMKPETDSQILLELQKEFLTNPLIPSENQIDIFSINKALQNSGLDLGEKGPIKGACVSSQAFQKYFDIDISDPLIFSILSNHDLSYNGYAGFIRDEAFDGYLSKADKSLLEKVLALATIIGTFDEVVSICKAYKENPVASLDVDSRVTQYVDFVLKEKKADKDDIKFTHHMIISMNEKQNKEKVQEPEFVAKRQRKTDAEEAPRVEGQKDVFSNISSLVKKTQLRLDQKHCSHDHSHLGTRQYFRELDLYINLILRILNYSEPDFSTITIPDGYIDVPHDGYCFYHAVAAQISSSNADLHESAINMQQNAIQHILENMELYRYAIGWMNVPGLNLSQMDPIDAMNAYLEYQSNLGIKAWADNIMIQAVSNYYSAYINVHMFNQDGTPSLYLEGEHAGQNQILNFIPSNGDAPHHVTIANINNMHFVTQETHNEEGALNSIPTTLLSTAKKRCLNDDDHHTTEESSTQVTRTNHSLSSSYDNPILNNPKLLKVALEFEGFPFVNRLINIGMNPKYCVAILAAYEDNGFEAMKSELIKLEAVEELAQQKAKDNLVHYIPIFDRLRDKDYTDESLDRETETFVNIFDKITTSFLELFGGLAIDLDVQTSYLMVWGEMLAASAPQFFGSPRRGNTDPDPDFGGYGGGEQATNMPEFGVSMFIAGNDNVNITLASE